SVLLKNSGRLTGELSDTAPQMRAALAELRVTLAKAGVAAEQLGLTAQSTKDVLDSEGRPLAKQLAKTLAETDRTLAKLTETMEEARPGLRQFSTTTLPETEALVRDLRVTARALSAITEKIDQEGATGLLGGPPLPDYKPKN
ncbi:MAG: MlaD family protein, partial [Blastomonas fulva]